jgi:transcriptional regulator with XRE-family HTH domain
MSIGARVRELRTKLGISQYELARRAGVSQGFVHLVERGWRMPRIHTLVCLAKALEVPVEQLLSVVEEGDDDAVASH